MLLCKCDSTAITNKTAPYCYSLDRQNCHKYADAAHFRPKLCALISCCVSNTLLKRQSAGSCRGLFTLSHNSTNDVQHRWWLMRSSFQLFHCLQAAPIRGHHSRSPVSTSFCPLPTTCMFSASSLLLLLRAAQSRPSDGLTPHCVHPPLCQGKSFTPSFLLSFPQWTPSPTQITQLLSLSPSCSPSLFTLAGILLSPLTFFSSHSTLPGCLQSLLHLYFTLYAVVG